MTALSIAEEEAVDALVGAVVGFLHDKDKDIRALALEQIRTEAKGAASTKAFAAELEKLPPDGQVGLLRALAARGDSEAQPAVAKCLASADAAVKLAAIEATGALGNADDTAKLVELLSSPVSDEQKAARGSLVRLRGENVSTLIAGGLQSAVAPLRVTLIEILAERRGLDTIPDLLIQAKDEDSSVRAAAMKALGQLASAEHLPGMVAGVLAAEPGKEREAAEKNVAAVCNKIEDANERDVPLLLVVERQTPAAQILLLSTLGRVGGPAALRAVEHAIGDQIVSFHEAGVRALCNWPNASVAPRLMELAKTEEKEALRILALRALIRVAPLADSRTDEERLALLKQAMEMSTRDEEKLYVLDRARTVRTMDVLHFIVPYMDQPAFAEQACLSIVEMAHHRTLRQPNKAEFKQVLDKVIATSKDEVVIDRAKRYQNDQTWVRPKKAE